MTEAAQSIAHTLREIRRMPYGTARTAAAESVARRVEAEGPRDLLPEALLDLIEAYTFAGEGPKSFTAFARTIRLWDESPELFDSSDERNLFWEFKWVAGDLPDYPEISRPQAEAFLTDMRHRFDVAGKGPSSVAMSDFRWAWHAGLPTMDAARLTWLTTPRDEFDDCLACTIGQQVDYFTEVGRFAEAVELGRSQSSKCNLEPTRTLHALALALLAEGEVEESARTHRRAVATLDTTDSDFAPARGQGFELLARGGHFDRALRSLRDDYSDLLLTASSPLFRLRFLLSVLAGLSANLDRADTPTGLRSIDAPTVGDLHAWVAREAGELARRFDERGATDYYAGMYARALAAEQTGLTLPLDVQVAPVIEPAAYPSAHPSADAGAAPASVVSAHARAEASSAAGDHASAAVDYAIAAAEAEEAGLLSDAGLAWAEAARSAQLLGDDTAAHERYGHAVPRLVSGGIADEIIAHVLVTWAPSASRLGDSEGILTLIERHLEREPAASIRADLLDTLARVVASAPSTAEGRDAAAAVSAAHAAGELYAQSGATAAAAHAFWVAGRVQRELGDDEPAVWSLESAVEGFQIARDRANQAEAAGDLIELLRSMGREARADEIVASLVSSPM